MSKVTPNIADTPHPRINVESCSEEAHKSSLPHREEQKDRLKAPAGLNPLLVRKNWADVEHELTNGKANEGKGKDSELQKLNS